MLVLYIIFTDAEPRNIVYENNTLPEQSKRRITLSKENNKEKPSQKNMFLQISK